jgi:iron-sulfur cluster repair protein YtfE (RIC family)
MSYRLDYNELLPNVIARMKREHNEFHEKIERIQDLVNTQNLTVALSLLSVLKTEILRHAVEEEAIVARSIMKHRKDESQQSIQVLQGHREVTRFFNEVLPKLPSSSRENEVKQINDFISFLMKHHSEEEAIVFPLALKGVTLEDQGTRKSNRNHLKVTAFSTRHVKDFRGKPQKTMLQKCSNCGKYLTMDGEEISADLLAGVPSLQ